MIDHAPCPCCGHSAAPLLRAPYPHWHCPCCLHRWRAGGLSIEQYRRQSGRTPTNPVALERKHSERIGFLHAELSRAKKVLDIGCAEGLFGERVKQLFPTIEYVGVEVSQDATQAASRLDRVYHGTLVESEIHEPFDLVVCFHLLEHLPDPYELLSWIERLVTPGGRLAVEVPCGSGNLAIPWDRNVEHLHFFSPISLAAMVGRTGYEVLSLEREGYESDVYDDALRLRACHRPSLAEREEACREALARLLGPQGVVYGVGGDFRNWVEPYLDDALIAAYLDARPELAITPESGRKVEPPDALLRYPSAPILIASYRFQEEIHSMLQSEFAVFPQRIVTLGMVTALAREISDGI
jgi:SAM-dependent methyltransferase